MITCKEVATLLDAGTLGRETLWKRINVRLHLTLCRHCRRFKRQLRRLRAGIQSFRSEIDSEASARRFEERMCEALDSTNEGDA